MTVLVLGAAGFIGSAIVAALERAGHQARCVVRNPANFQTRFPNADVRAVDLAKPRAALEETWIPLLDGVDGVVNAAGVLQPPSRAQAWAIHRDAPDALFRACESAGVRRVVHISAVGIDASQMLYARSKRAGEAALRARDLDWTIVRPVIVIGDGSYGGTSLIRALAAFPFAMPVIDRSDSLIGTIHNDDLAAGVASLVCGRKGIHTVIEAAAPDPKPLAELYAAYRRWLGVPGARVVRIPMPIARVAAVLGDLTRAHPITTTTLAQASGPLEGNPGAFESVTGIKPRGLESVLAARPAGTQDLWHARLFLIKPVLRLVLSVLWAVSGLTVLLSLEAAATVSVLLPLPAVVGTGAVLAAGALDLVIAAALFRHWKPALTADVQLVAAFGYTLVLSVFAPELWADPLGALVKNIALIVLILVHRVLERER